MVLLYADHACLVREQEVKSRGKSKWIQKDAAFPTRILGIPKRKQIREQPMEEKMEGNLGHPSPPSLSKRLFGSFAVRLALKGFFPCDLAFCIFAKIMFVFLFSSSP